MYKDILNNILDNFLFLTTAYICYLLVSLFLIDLSIFSDDQTSYILRAQSIAAGQTSWQVGHLFPYLLAKTYLLTHDFKTSLLIIYSVICFAYFHLAHAGFQTCLHHRTVALFLTIISLTPHYTLGMTFWGFSGGEFITARILVMPFVPVIMALFLKNLDDPQIFWLYFFCIFLSLAHLSAIFLMGVLILFYGLYRVFELRFNLDRSAASYIAASIWCGVWVEGLIFLASSSNSLDFFLTKTYAIIANANLSHIMSLSDSEYLNLFWESMSAAFWWAMFPPRITDLLYFLFESSLLLLFGLAGFMVLKKENQDLFRKLTILLFSIIIASYGFQTCLWLGWKLFGLGPKIFEEVRTFKFFYFPVFIAIGFFLLKQNPKIRILVFLLLVISPFGLIKKTPDDFKIFISNQFDRVFQNPIYSGYVKKALLLRPDDLEDLDHMISILKNTGPDEAMVMTTLHQIKRSGKGIIVSYQDKRSGRQVGPDSRADEIVFWFTAYQEVNQAVQSRDPEQILETARKYGTEYVILEHKQDDPNFSLIFQGKKYWLYEIELD